VEKFVAMMKQKKERLALLDFVMATQAQTFVLAFKMFWTHPVKKESLV